jgi:hypothetical protein
MIKTTAQAQPAGAIAYLPPQKATNKRIYPVQNEGGPAVRDGDNLAGRDGLPQDRQVLDPSIGRIDVPHQPAPEMTTASSGGLLQTVKQPPLQTLYQPPQTLAPTTPEAAPKQQAVTSQPQQAIATTSAPTLDGGGLLQRAAGGAPINISKPVKPDSPTVNFTAPTYKPVGAELSAKAPTITVPTSSGGGSTYKSDGYTGVQGNTNFSYKPGEDSLVENRINGLLDPNSALMRKAAALGNAYAANRGLQSSSIGGEIALSTMVDKALPIASQDATTANQAQQLGWQQSWQSGENNLNRTHDTSMFDKNGKLQTDLQNSQQQFQASENNANRSMQAELQKLQYQQSLGLLDAQGAQRTQEMGIQQQFQAQMQDLQYKQNLGQLDYQGQQQLQQLERNAQLQQQRDQLMQSFDKEKMDSSYLQQLELTKVQYDQSDKTLMAQMTYDTQMKFKNATESALNAHLDKVGNIWADPNMTSEQKKAGTELLKSQLESHRATLEAIYGFTGTTGGGTPPPKGENNPNPPLATTGPQP